MIYPGGCQRGRRTSPGLGSRRLSPQFLSPRFQTFCLMCFIGGEFFDNHVHCAGHLWAFHDPGHTLPVQSGIFGCFWRGHTTGAKILFKEKCCNPPFTRSMKDFSKTWQPSPPWWRQEEGNTTTSIQRMLLAASISEDFTVGYLKHVPCSIGIYILTKKYLSRFLNILLQTII